MRRVVIRLRSDIGTGALLGYRCLKTMTPLRNVGFSAITYPLGRSPNRLPNAMMASLEVLFVMAVLTILYLAILLHTLGPKRSGPPASAGLVRYAKSTP